MNNYDKKLIFVYNAGSSIFAQVTDYAHKLISPSTYECNLCKLTHTNFGAKKQWKEFLNQLPIKMEFLHKDELEQKQIKIPDLKFPSVLLESDSLEILLSAEEINQISDLEGLEQTLKSKLTQKGLL